LDQKEKPECVGPELGREKHLNVLGVDQKDEAGVNVSGIHRGKVRST
jgi:hypothetical protein